IASPVCTDPTNPRAKSPDTSVYRRNAELAAAAGTPASETITPSRRSEKTTNPVGLGSLPVGVTRTEPLRTDGGNPEVLIVCKPLGGIEQLKLLAVCPSTTSVAAFPAGSKNWTVQASCESVGLTSTICVVQPPPSA